MSIVIELANISKISKISKISNNFFTKIKICIYLVYKLKFVKSILDRTYLSNDIYFILFPLFKKYINYLKV